MIAVHRNQKGGRREMENGIETARVVINPEERYLDK
jgi:hypothetical protein